MQTYAKKLGMTHYWDENGTQKVATVLELLSTVYAGKRTQDRDGYDASIYALVTDKAKTNKSLAGQFKGISNIKKVREQKVKPGDDFKVGTGVTIDQFKENDEICIYGKSKGKGFAGTVKRHGFNTGPKTHGSNNYRQPGSIGDTGPSRVVKGKKMGGHMGSTQVKIKKVKIAKVEVEKNRIWLNSPIPGANKSLILIEKND